MTTAIVHTRNWLNLSSADRLSGGTSNNFIIQLNSGSITSDSGGYFGSKSFINPIFFSFPNNAPNIQADFNNVFYISGSKFAGTTPYKKLFLTPGLYQNVGQLCAYIQSIINGYIGTVDGTTLPVAYTGTIAVSQASVPTDLTYNRIKFVFTSATAGESLNIYLSDQTPISFVSTNPENFGLVAGTDVNFTVSTSSTTFTLPFLPNLNIYDIIQVKCNLCSSTYEIESGSLSQSLIMVAFPSANFVVNDTILFNNNNPYLYRQPMHTSNYDSIQIQVCDKNGRLIPFVGEVDFSITIERETYTEPINLQRVKDQSPYSAPTMYK
tara:strand:- start:4 stop:975 length:972 start_codon:yes stop_codon:yes gene_type:complete